MKELINSIDNLYNTTIPSKFMEYLDESIKHFIKIRKINTDKRLKDIYLKLDTIKLQLAFDPNFFVRKSWCFITRKRIGEIYYSLLEIQEEEESVK